jgi:hypothetical protein
MSVNTSAFAQAQVTRVFTKDRFAYAQYVDTSPDGCTSSSVEVFASESMTRYNTTDAFFPIIRAQRFAYNFCTFVLVFMSGANEQPSLSYSKDLSSATASGLVMMTDDFGNPHSIEVNLTWSGGVLTSDKSRTVFTSPRSRTMIKSVSSLRHSESVTGSLVLNGVDLLGADNPNYVVGVSGFVSSSKGSTIDIIRY